MQPLRKPFQGVRNIIAFNWHFYLVALTVIILLMGAHAIWFRTSFGYLLIAAFVILVTVLISLVLSMYIYDFSNLYTLNWLDRIAIDPPRAILNVHAGFDETTPTLRSRYPGANLQLLDFYDPEKHTELSIKRARSTYPPEPGTFNLSTGKVPFEEERFDLILALLSAHEIRDEVERVRFFTELSRTLKKGGHVIITEHLRDFPNFIAYTIGFLHFHSRKTWLRTFEHANLRLLQEIKVTPFITTFVVQHA